MLATATEQVCQARLRLVLSVIPNLPTKPAAIRRRPVDILLHHEARKRRIAAATLTTLGSLSAIGLPHLLLPLHVLTRVDIGAGAQEWTDSVVVKLKFLH